MVPTVRKTQLENWGHSTTRYLVRPDSCSPYVNPIPTSRSQGNHKLETPMRTKQLTPTREDQVDSGKHSLVRECQGQFQCSQLRLLFISRHVSWQGGSDLSALAATCFPEGNLFPEHVSFLFICIALRLATSPPP